MRLLYGCIAPLFLALAATLQLDAATVDNVRAQQRPKTKVVDVYYDLVADGGELFDVSVSFSAPGKSPKVATLEGDVGEGILPGRNKHIVWDAGTDWPDNADDNFEASVRAEKSGRVRDGGMVLIPGGTISDSGDGYRLCKNPPSPPDSTINLSVWENREWTSLGSVISRYYPTGSVVMHPYFMHSSEHYEDEAKISYEYAISAKDFYMDRTEITFEHWSEIYHWGIDHGYEFDYRGEGKGLNHPVHSVTGYDMLKWCNARSEKEGKTPAYMVYGEVYRKGRMSPTADLDSEGYRLPTKNEWIYAARGGQSGYIHACGDRISHEQANYYGYPRGGYSSMGIDDSGYCVLWFADVFGYRESYKEGEEWQLVETYSGVIRSVYAETVTFDSSRGYNPLGSDGVQPYTTPVGSFPASSYGLYDMLGNVSECTYEGNGRCFNMGGSYSTYGLSMTFRSLTDKSDTSIPTTPSVELGFRCVHR